MLNIKLWNLLLLSNYKTNWINELILSVWIKWKKNLTKIRFRMWLFKFYICEFIRIEIILRNKINYKFRATTKFHSLYFPYSYAPIFFFFFFFVIFLKEKISYLQCLFFVITIFMPRMQQSMLLGVQLI